LNIFSLISFNLTKDRILNKLIIVVCILWLVFMFHESMFVHVLSVSNQTDELYSQHNICKKNRL